MANIRQVAELAGVSPATASRVLGTSASRPPVSVDAGRRVREAASTLGYRVNYHMRAVATGRANATGFASEVTLDPHAGVGSGNMYFDALRRGVEYTTQEAGSALMSVHPGRGLSALQRGTQYLMEHRLDALVIPASKFVVSAAHLFEADPQLPLVLINYDGKINRPNVWFDLPAAMRLIVDHLACLGHRRALWFGPQSDPDSGISQRQRLFIQTAWETGLQGATCLANVEPLGRFSESDKLIDLARAAMTAKLAEPDRNWTAIVAYNDQWAVAACAALAAAGLRVPTDVSVVGFDNLIGQFCVPALTTIDHQFYEMGRRAGSLAAQLIEATAEQRQTLNHHIETVAPLLIHRATTAPAKT
ncbi:MAG: LacI family DNA-binding transcriptional regulator [Phycisphaeraceae bacterium]